MEAAILIEELLQRILKTPIERLVLALRGDEVERLFCERIARFLEQLDQRQAARKVGISRTTLVYQEARIRRLLRRFLRRGDMEDARFERT